MLRSRLSWITASVFFLLGGGSLTAADSSLYQPLEQQAPQPNAQTPFAQYLASQKAHIRTVLERDYFSVREDPFGPDYTLDDVVAMRAPYELSPSAMCTQEQKTLGFLLIHGLTDSPYLLSDIAASLQVQYPCALIRGLLLPGHGTVPGDTLAMNYQDWISITEYGVNSFRGEVDKLFMLGFSTGTSLSVLYADSHRDDDLVQGLIMLSPAITARSGLAFLSPYLSWFRDWLSERPETDAARYESFSVNAGAQFYKLTKNLSSSSFVPLTIPIFMAASADDSTVNMDAAREFFCAKAASSQRQMLWFQTQQTPNLDRSECSGLQILPGASEPFRVVNMAHTSLTMSPENPHYGAQGNYRLCMQYGHQTPDFKQCVSDEAQTVYGESGLGEGGRYQGKLIRRGSFNPYYDLVFTQIVRFIENTQ